MKKIVSALLLVVLMMGAVTGQAFAVDSHTEFPTGDLAAILDSGQIQQVGDVSDVSADGDIAMPLAGGVTRLNTMGIIICPLVEVGGKAQPLTDEIYQFIVEPLSFQNYLRDYMTVEEQETIKTLVTAAGYEQVGWYMITGYNIDSYRPLRFSYYEWTGAGQSSLKGKTARNGDNIFELYSYFEDETSTSYKFGITGNVTYQNYAGGSTVTMPIELTVTFR